MGKIVLTIIAIITWYSIYSSPFGEDGYIISLKCYYQQNLAISVNSNRQVVFMQNQDSSQNKWKMHRTERGYFILESLQFPCWYLSKTYHEGNCSGQTSQDGLVFGLSQIEFLKVGINYSKDKIINKFCTALDYCIDVPNANFSILQYLIAWRYHSGNNQMWQLDYGDKRVDETLFSSYSKMSILG